MGACRGRSRRCSPRGWRPATGDRVQADVIDETVDYVRARLAADQVFRELPLNDLPLGAAASPEQPASLIHA